MWHSTNTILLPEFSSVDVIIVDGFHRHRVSPYCGLGEESGDHYFSPRRPAKPRRLSHTRPELVTQASLYNSFTFIHTTRRYFFIWEILLCRHLWQWKDFHEHTFTNYRMIYLSLPHLDECCGSMLNVPIDYLKYLVEKMNQMPAKEDTEQIEYTNVGPNIETHHLTK